MKRILVLEGGGAKGPFEIGVLQSIEERTNKKIADIFDAFVTTSIGSVNASILVTKKLTCADIGKLMMTYLPDIFKKRFLRVPKYDREAYVKLFHRFVGSNIKLGNAKTNFVITSTNMCDGLNHFFKSYKDDEGALPITEATCRSFAAPLYFGQVNDPKAKAIWLDGGCGIENLPLWQAYVEARRLNWIQEGLHIMAIGCGHSRYSIPYDEGSKGGPLRQTARAIRYFNSIVDGSLARNQSTAVQVATMKALADASNKFTFQYIDWPGYMPKRLDKMDNVKARYEYYETGLAVGLDVDIKPLEG